jgi:hypothetical protein
MSLGRREGESLYGECDFSRVGEVVGRGLRGVRGSDMVLQGIGMSVGQTFTSDRCDIGLPTYRD